MVDRRSPRSHLLLVAIAIALTMVACGDGADENGSGGRFVAVDGSPRPPDDEGVLSAIAADNSTITIDGEHVYDVHEDLQSFSSVDGSVQPLRSRVGHYVHVGLDGDTAVWVAGIGTVTRLEGVPQTVNYLGTIASAEDRRVVLVDGTVFRLADDVDVPDEVPVEALLRVSVVEDAVVEVRPAADAASGRGDG